MVVGLRVAVSPADGLAVNMTFELNPLLGKTVIVQVAVSPAFTFTAVQLEAMVKSPPRRWMLTTKVLWNVRLKVRK
jgi:steroid 5-alpha reductase family enzyme